jgi:hypothetical protein
MFLRTTLLLAVATIAGLCHAAKITRITPNAGGILGGTRVTVVGEGFDIRGRSNDVYIGSATSGIFCDPIPNECHETRIVCLTDAAPLALRGPQTLSVKSFGFVATCGITAGCTFSVLHDYTPTVSAITPQWISDPADITVSGARFAQGDATVASFDFTLHVGEEERCDIGTRTIDWSGFTCGMNSLPFAGDKEVALQLGTRGNAEIAATVLIVPTVQGVTPSNGSTAGGQRLTVYGTAFGRDVTQLKVRVHGVPCQVAEVTEDFLICTTSAHDETTAKSPNYIPGRVLVEGWTGPGATSIASLYNDLRVNQPDTQYTQGTLAAIDPAGREDGGAFRLTTLFTPNVTGNYTFQIAADDEGELWIGEDETPVPRVVTAVTDADPTFARRIARCPYYTSAYDSYIEQTGWVELIAGRAYWMQVLVANSGSSTSAYIRASVSGQIVFDQAPPAALTALPDPWQPPVEVWVSSMRAAVGRACLRRGTCNYDYSAAATARVTSVTPTSLSGATNSLIITGSGFATSATSNIVTIGGASCIVTTASATELRCTTTAAVPTGSHRVRVRIAGKGYAGNAVTVTASPTIAAVSNSAANISIVGTGFGSDASRVTVRIGGAACVITALSDGRLRAPLTLPYRQERSRQPWRSLKMTPSSQIRLSCSINRSCGRVRRLRLTRPVCRPWAATSGATRSLLCPCRGGPSRAATSSPSHWARARAAYCTRTRRRPSVRLWPPLRLASST